ncbi:putative acetoacetate decarboxylase (plasmid) [Streptantibioticus cattleyicolor NRRL 8057 = DSM 46488]|nr:acetoacetate decarboxylase [Streptantibioticus cattleyicolor]CCB71778.1 putative acetoacetate decarboxylase [Streptantibioticus cattleyicolor NRRL 8057 = DSM 46488]
MRAEDVLKHSTTPLAGPAFPAPPYRFTDREYLTVSYLTDIDVVRRLVPEPLRVTEPLVRFEVMRMPDVTGLGDYTEAGQLIAVEYEGERGEYAHAMYVDSGPAIASGREVGAYPKKTGAPRLQVDSDTLVGTVDYGSLRVATATMGYKHRVVDPEAARERIGTPAYLLKTVPGYDGRPRICELVRTRITDLTVKGAWSGPARLQLFAHALAPMADLPVREVVDACHILTDLSLGRAQVVHDYLTGAAPGHAADTGPYPAG